MRARQRNRGDGRIAVWVDDDQLGTALNGHRHQSIAGQGEAIDQTLNKPKVMYYEVYQDAETRWRWKLIRKRSAQILAISGEAFDNQVGCRQSVFVGPQIVLALRRNGRVEEAARLLRLTNGRLEQWAAAGRAGVIQELAKAKLHVLAGRRNEALTALEQAAALGWLDQFWPFLSLGDSVFDPVRADPRFRSVERRIQAKIRRERAELARLGSV